MVRPALKIDICISSSSGYSPRHEGNSLKVHADITYSNQYYQLEYRPVNELNDTFTIAFTIAPSEINLTITSSTSLSVLQPQFHSILTVLKRARKYVYWRGKRLLSLTKNDATLLIALHQYFHYQQVFNFLSAGFYQRHKRYIISEMSGF